MTPYISGEGITGGVPYVTVSGCGNFSVHKTFDCGQAFRFDPTDEKENEYSGVAFGKRITVTQLSDGVIRILGSDRTDYTDIWEHYLSLDTDYDAIDRSIIENTPSGHDRDEMEKAVRCGSGIRILRQDAFECLISFIISQNNNIPRIKKIVAAMCEKYGENGAFPSPEALVSAGEDGIFALRTGFRAKYIYDAAVKVASGGISLDEIRNCEDYRKCTDILCTIKGVGPKVSSCVLLFGFGKTEAFPVDVWIRRSLEIHFPNGFSPEKLGRYAGIAQQYLFYYERYSGGVTKGEK